jgi:acyl dehydratase/putative sterol carrier protein
MELTEARAVGDVSLFYEDLTPGARFDLGTFSVGREMLEAFAVMTGDDNPLHLDAAAARSRGFGGQVVHGALVSAMVMGLLERSGLVSGSVVAMMNADWSYRGPLGLDETAHVEMYVVSRRLTKSRPLGIVGRTFTVQGPGDALIAEAFSQMLVRARDIEAVRRSEADLPSFVSGDWLSVLGRTVAQDGAFTQATRYFDGTIGLEIDEIPWGWRIYQGKVIDQGARLASEATFTVTAPARTWLDFAESTHNYIPFAMQGRFRVRGSRYEYARMSAAIVALTEIIKEMVRDGMHAGVKDAQR